MEIQIVNSNTLSITGILKYTGDPITTVVDNTSQQSVSIGDSYDFTEKEYTTVYNVGILQKKTKKHCVAFTEEYTDANIYLLPMLYTETFSNYTSFGDPVNTYTDGVNKIYIKYRFFNDAAKIRITKQLRGHPNYTRKINEYNKYFTLLEFTIKDTFKPDYSRFLNSHWHKFSPYYKGLFASFNGISKNNIHYRIIQNDPVLRETMEEILGCPIPKNIPLKSKITAKEILIPPL